MDYRDRGGHGGRKKEKDSENMGVMSDGKAEDPASNPGCLCLKRSKL